jgi:pyruvate carboxylase
VVRTYYRAFDNAPPAGTAEVYLHEMPGGQYTNLREQAESMGLGERWNEIARAYAEVNMAFGDIVKVTPSSKVVGDLAIFLVTHNMTIKDLERLGPDHNLTLPNSVVEMVSGSLGEPEGGWPPAVKAVVLRGKEPVPGRPGEHLPPVDFEQTAASLEKKAGRVSTTDVMSYLMYPDVFLKFAKARAAYGNLEVLPTPQFFYGLERGEEVVVDIEPGKTLIIKFLAASDPQPDGGRMVIYELNGQPREVTIRDRSQQPKVETRAKADASAPGQVGAPIPGAISSIAVEIGQTVNKGDKLLIMEAMKMQSTIYSPVGGKVQQKLVNVGDKVESKDLLLVIE